MGYALEATALHIVIATVEKFISAFEQGVFGPKHRDDFNAEIAQRYEGIRDYIVAHYKVNQRADADGKDYWQAARSNQNLSENLKALLTAWYTGAQLDGEVARLDLAKYYTSISWHCLFAGYGVFPEDTKMRLPGADVTITDMSEIDCFLNRCAMNFL